MTPRDVFQYANDLDDSTINSIIERLEFRSRDPNYNRWLNDYLEAMGLEPSARVLDMGCGTGVAARGLARRPDFQGRIVGVDQSPPFIEAARRLADEEGISKNIEFRVGDAHSTGIADASFDAAMAHTLISHVSEPVAVLKEMSRLVVAGGLIAVFDGDYASLSFGCSDPDLGRKMEEGMIGVMVSNPRVMREMPQLLGDAGMELVSATPHVYSEIGSGRFWRNFAEVYAPMVSSAGVLPSEQVETWLEEQRSSVDRGTFFAVCNYFTYLARKRG